MRSRYLLAYPSSSCKPWLIIDENMQNRDIQDKKIKQYNIYDEVEVLKTKE